MSGIQGTGLGMSIAKSIVDLMGGDIDLVTAKGKGTEFILHLTFPLGSGGGKEAEEEGGEERSENTQFAGKRLLLVDDIELNRDLANLLLSELGFEIEEAENGREAVAKVEMAEPGYYDLILMDVQMPVMNGYDATKRIRTLAPEKANVPILAMTANAFAEDVKAANDAGMNGHIAKPLDVSALALTLQKVLHS